MHLLNDLMKNISYVEVKQEAKDTASWKAGGS